MIERDGYLLFLKKWPSNWHKSPFVLDGQAYNCMEQFMMAEKARIFGDLETRQAILLATKASVQKSLGRQVKGYDEEVWKKHRYEVVLRGTLAKYRQNDDLRQLLLATGDLQFVEVNPVDCIWGVAMDENDPDATNPAKWRGLNLLGKIITEARSIIRAETA